MICGIHQPHYFPWLGYFDKIAKAEKFAIMDEVQLEPRSVMCRNVFLDRNGERKILTVSVEKSNYREKPLRDICVCDIKKTQRSHFDFFKSTYKYAPYRDEILGVIQPVFSKDYVFLFDILMDTIMVTMQALGIQTEIVLQSELGFVPTSRTEAVSPELRRSADVLNMCMAMGATDYITGTGGSLGFLQPNDFEKQGITLYIQNYACPEYRQLHAEEFIPNISALDLLFSCGIEKARELFRANLRADYPYKEGIRLYRGESICDD